LSFLSLLCCVNRVTSSCVLWLSAESSAESSLDELDEDDEDEDEEDDEEDDLDEAVLETLITNFSVSDSMISISLFTLEDVSEDLRLSL
jgi:hypothetical protein